MSATMSLIRILHSSDNLGAFVIFSSFMFSVMASTSIFAANMGKKNDANIKPNFPNFWSWSFSALYGNIVSGFEPSL